MMLAHIRSLRGFTLIEMMLVLIIVGAIISAAATIVPATLKTAKLKEARAGAESMDITLEGYFAATGRLPCPDTDATFDPATAATGAENRNDNGTPTDFSDDTCPRYEGWLPYKTLGLNAGTDAWGMPYRYGVYENMVKTAPGTVCNSMSSMISATSSATKLHVQRDDNSIMNYAYVLVSGGELIPGQTPAIAGARFNLENDDQDVQFESPERTINLIDGNPNGSYNDLVRAVNLTSLKGDQCSGSLGGSGTETGGVTENTEAFCQDKQDNDKDGKADCDDLKCANTSFCADKPVKITSTTLTPDGVTGNYYTSGTLSAVGGSYSYYWYLSGETLNLSTLAVNNVTQGVVSGDIKDCPNNFTVTVKAKDRQDPNRACDPTTCEMQLPFKVSYGPEAGLTINPTSGIYSAGSNPQLNFQQPSDAQGFELKGPIQGTVNWSFGGATPTGFSITVDSVDSRKAKLWISGTTTPVESTTVEIKATHGVRCTPPQTASATYTMRVSSNANIAAFRKKMEAEWHFDECAAWSSALYNVVDAMGIINGTEARYGSALNSAAQSHSGKLCRSAFFPNVTGAKISSKILTDDDIMTFAGEITIAAWVRANRVGASSGGTHSRVVELGNNTRVAHTALTAYTPVNPPSAVTTSTDIIKAWTSSTSGTQIGLITFDTARHLRDGKWHHLAYTFKIGTEAKIYLDGVLKKTVTDTSTATTIKPAESFAIGNAGANNTYPFRGYIDEVMVFSEALDATTIADIYNLERTCGDSQNTCYTGPEIKWAMDETGSWSGAANEVKDTGSLGTAHGQAQKRNTGALPTKTDSSIGKICKAALFTRTSNTTGGKIDFGNPSTVNPTGKTLTIATWINSTSNQNTSVYHKEGLLEGQVVGATPYFRYRWRPDWNWRGSTAITPTPSNTWTHVATSYDGQTITTYLNGNLAYFVNQNNVIGPANGNNFFMGASATSGANGVYFFGGMVDQTVIYPRALADNEVRDLVNSNDTCPPTDLTISTASLPTATFKSAYSATLQADGGTSPYAWQGVSIPSGWSVTSNLNDEGTLAGTASSCPDTYSVQVKVTDAASPANSDTKSFSLTVTKGALIYNPTNSQPLLCTSNGCYVTISVSAPQSGEFNWGAVTWQAASADFSISKTGASTAVFKDNGSSTNGVYGFKTSVTDTSCPNNTFTLPESGWYSLVVQK